MKKMLMLATTAAMIEQFNKNNILILEEMGYEVHVAGNWKEGNPISDERLEQFKEWLSNHHGKWFHISATRKPYDIKNNFSAYKEVVRLIKEYEYDFIHCHTPIGSVIGRIAAHFTKTKIIYTAHGFHFYKGAPLINWLLYYPVEWFLSYWTDVLITINKEDYERALGKFHAKTIKYVPGVGIDIKKGDSYTVDREKKRSLLGLQEDDIMILSVGELIPRKNHELVIRALGHMKEKHLKYFICGQGELKDMLVDLAKDLGIESQVRLLGFRNDVLELCKSADIYAFPSHQEGLSVAMLEAMTMKVPIVCSRIRGNVELIDDSKCIFKDDSVLELSNCINHVLKKIDCGMKKMTYKQLKKYSIDNVSFLMKQVYIKMSVKK